MQPEQIVYRSCQPPCGEVSGKRLIHNLSTPSFSIICWCPIFLLTVSPPPSPVCRVNWLEMMSNCMCPFYAMTGGIFPYKGYIPPSCLHLLTSTHVPLPLSPFSPWLFFCGKQMMGSLSLLGYTRSSPTQAAAARIHSKVIGGIITFVNNFQDDIRCWSESFMHGSSRDELAV